MNLDAINSFEEIKSNQLRKIISGENNFTKLDSEILNSLIDKNEAVLIFTESSFGNYISILITQDEIIADELELSGLNDFKWNARGGKLIKLDSYPQLDNEERAVENFRNGIDLLINNFVSTNTEDEKIRNSLSNKFYNLILGKIEKKLSKIDDLVIIPGGILNLIPFEALIDNDGKFMAEKFNIKYNYSISILKLLNNREYSTNRKSIIAFGSPVFNNKQNSNDFEVFNNMKQINYIRGEAVDLSVNNSKLTSIYEKLGYSDFDLLPGASKELENIENVFSKSEVINKDNFTESKLKSMSENNELKDYKIIHFATHGVAIPEVPELSCLILSETSKDSLNDHYLTMNEILKLKINADLVTLSACETALGKIYSGEGIVGLTQAFFAAGVNGVLASLWQVSDESTSIFMTEFYKIYKSENIDFELALSKVKKKFILGEFGEKFGNPVYWAPFVYYGK